MNAPLPDLLPDLRHIGIGLNPCEAALNESSLVVLDTAIYDALFALGISGDAITGLDAFDALHVEHVSFLPGRRFELTRNMRDQSSSTLAIIIPVREGGRTVDLCAWDLNNGTLATWRGAPLLGQDVICAPRIEADGVRVYVDPVEWLRAGRRGIVVIDATGARWRLAEERLIVRDADFGRRLRHMLRIPEPRVFVESTGRAAA